MQDALENWGAQLNDFGQAHLLKYWNELPLEERQFLKTQLESIDFREIADLIAGVAKNVDWNELSMKAIPPTAIRLREQNPLYSEAEARERGEQAIRDGKIGMILVAGGQGTRLGFDLPKGMFRIGPVSNRSLFAMHVDSVRGAMRRFAASIPMYVMTSPATDLQTREYFDRHQCMGLKPDELIIFCQGTMPAVDTSSGRILMESKSSIALSPDGHGGIVLALERHGILKSAADRGIEHFFYAQVDNPMVRACDPTLIGYHLLSSSQLTTQVVKKRFGVEKVGNVVSIDGRTHIIEYSDLPERVANRTNANGELDLWAGNIAVHVMELSFLASSTRNAASLPFHRATKSMPFLNDEGVLEEPSSPNATKFERFVFDLLPLADRAIVVEADAAEVFAPVKNAEGAPTDTPSAARDAISSQHKRWLVQAGLTVRSGVKVEINPHWALDADEVRMKIQQPSSISVDTYFA